MLTLPGRQKLSEGSRVPDGATKTYRAKFRVIPKCRQTLTCHDGINRRENELESIQSSAIPLPECCCDPRIKTPNLQVSYRRLKLEGCREEGRNGPDEDASLNRHR